MNILLVEDDPDDVELLLEALHDNNIEFMMESIKEGDKVLSYLELCKNLPDIIILDLNLPKMHGREVLISLKGSRFSVIPVVILTTSSSREDIDFCLKSGADTFISKPSTVEGFNKTVMTIAAIASQTEKHLR
ncbi:MAG TPA: response regulator [Ohtaekwangia sp.]|uniref:response regulator n=1 Tax=Ohtaekwangia sp. TaxID=2066019 RepID=UPI002F92BDB8